MPELQKHIDAGWQYVNPPGPNSYAFTKHTDYAGGIEFTWLSVSSFIVDFRRPARPLKEKEKQLIGCWQENFDPNSGFWNTLGNVVFSQKLNVKRLRYEFKKDHTVRYTDRDGQVSNVAVFFEEEDGELHIYHKYSPGDNTTISVDGDQLTFSGRSRQFSKFQRVPGQGT